MIENISVVGLGKLGEPLAVCLASRGFNVLGVDIDESKIDNLRQGKVNAAEPGLQQLLNNCIDRFEVTGDIVRAITETDVTFLMVNTPSDEDGRFSNQYLLLTDA